MLTWENGLGRRVAMCEACRSTKGDVFDELMTGDGVVLIPKGWLVVYRGEADDFLRGVGAVCSTKCRMAVSATDMHMRLGTNSADTSRREQANKAAKDRALAHMLANAAHVHVVLTDEQAGDAEHYESVLRGVVPHAVILGCSPEEEAEQQAARIIELTGELAARDHDIERAQMRINEFASVISEAVPDEDDEAPVSIIDPGDRVVHRLTGAGPWLALECKTVDVSMQIAHGDTRIAHKTTANVWMVEHADGTFHAVPCASLDLYVSPIPTPRRSILAPLVIYLCALLLCLYAWSHSER